MNQIHRDFNQVFSWHRLVVRAVFTFLLVAVFLPARAQHPHELLTIKGLYGDFAILLEQDAHIPSLNAAFARGYTVNAKHIQAARDKGWKVYAEFPTLIGKNYIEDHPEAWAINEKGERVQAADWFMGVCPTEPGFKAYRQQQLRELLQTHQLDGVFMDYLHYHAQFETPDPILPETCFCDHCLTSFEKQTGTALPEGTTASKAEFILHHHDTTWRNWRASVIAGWVADFEQIIEQEQPGTLLGVFHCPWDDDAHDGARRRILGLDYHLMRPHVDVFSPMVYHALLDESPQWIAENLEWFTGELNLQAHSKPYLWPIVQAYDNPRAISAAELHEVLRHGTVAPVSGIMLFSARALQGQKEKQNAIEDFYSKQNE